jgi:antitoxin CcdA
MANSTATGSRQRSRRVTKVTLGSDLIAAANQLGIDVSKSCEAGLRECEAQARRRHWLDENCESIDAYNARIEREGTTLVGYRWF